MHDAVFDRVSTMELLAFSEDLPSLPDRFIKIQKIAQDPNSDADDLAEVIKSDQATTVMILKFANSSAYNPSGIPIGELSKAIARLGSKETVHIATAMSLMYGIILPTGMANIRAFWSHAYAVGLVCEQLVHQIDPIGNQYNPERAFMVGLLHDIGRAALGMRVDFSYFERELGHLHSEELIRAEEALYGVNHAEAGQQLLSLWLFPDDLCQMVAEHHNPDSKLQLARICNLANHFVVENLPARLSFDSIYDEVQKALDKNPPDLTAITN